MTMLDARYEKKAKSKSYIDVLTKLAVAGAVALEVEKIELVLPKGQEDLIDTAAVAKQASKETGLKVSVIISKETVRASGGVIVRTLDGKKWVDNTFEARMDRMHNQIRDRISSELFTAK